MKTINPTQKIEFANSLRGIAVLLVLFGHYVFVFNALKGKFAAFPSLDFYPFPWALAILSPFPINQLNIGQVAVAFFFLVSGLVIPNAAASLGSFKHGRAAFVIGRVLRIWPTYMLGLMISVSALWFNSYANSAEFNIPVTQILANMTLFRDWLGQSHIDGIVWTLEIEAKFYLFVLLFWSDIGKGRLYPITLICIAAIVMAPLASNFDITNQQTITAANFLWTLPYLLYMSMGIVFNYHLRKLINTKTLIAAIVTMAAAFVYVAKTQALYVQVPVSYVSTLAVFTFLYFFARTWSGGPTIQFFSKISYPLYASHAALGYTGMAYMISRGIGPLSALAIQVAFSTALAWAMHIIVEMPTHNAGKRIGKWLVTRKATAKVEETNLA